MSELQSTCPVCTKTLPPIGFFCGGCLTQFKCKSCDSILERDDVGCVNCGTPKEVRAGANTASQQNINTFRMHETVTERTIEVTFTNDVAKDLAETLRDAAVAVRMKAIASNIPPPNDFNGTSEEKTEFVEADIINNKNANPKTEPINKSVLTEAAKQGEYLPLKEVAKKNLAGPETEWVIVYAFYASNYGNDTFTRQDIIDKYTESNRYNKERISNLSASIRSTRNSGYLNPLQDSYSILDKGIDKAKEIISRTSASLPKKAKSVVKKKNEDSKDVPETIKKTNKSSSTIKNIKRLANLNLEPEGKESLKDFISKYGPKNDKERNLLFTFYMESILALQDVTFDHIYSCYDVLDLAVSLNLSQTVRNTSSKTGWIEIKDSKISTTIKGRNQIKAWNKKDQ